MAQKSSIEWTESTWNPVTGCSKISAGCFNCYAERMANRLHAMGNKRYARGFEVTLHHDLIETPLSWKKPRTIFVNSMSDLFHEKIPASFIKEVFKTMAEAHWHNFQILTKRADRLAELAPRLQWPANVWMGVTVESQKYVDRINKLRTTDAAIKFLSIEPLISPIERISLNGIDWVIAGGESGLRCRPMSAEWVRTIRDVCIKEEVPFFFKQWGGRNKKVAGRLLDGKIWDEMPSLSINLALL